MKQREGDINQIWPIVDAPERAREEVQLRLTKSLFRLMLPSQELNRITAETIRTFISACDMVAQFEHIMHSDSVHIKLNKARLPFAQSATTVMEAIQNETNSIIRSNLLEDQDIIEVLQRISDYQVTEVDNELIMVLDEACDHVWRRKELEKRCFEELEETQDSIQRASLLLELGEDEEALLEYQNISSEELNNPENALDLVELMERFEGRKAAEQMLKKWFVLQAALHPIIFDLITDVIFPGYVPVHAIRLKHLRRLLLMADSYPFRKIKEDIALVLPSQLEFTIDPQEANRKLNLLGLHFVDIDGYINEEPFCIYTILNDICDQLNYLTALAIQSKDQKLALNAIERCLLCSMILLFLPSREIDIQFVTGFGSYNITHEWIVENLQEASALLMTIHPKSSGEKSIISYLKRLLNNLRYLIQLIGFEPLESTESDIELTQ